MAGPTVQKGLPLSPGVRAVCAPSIWASAGTSSLPTPDFWALPLVPRVSGVRRRERCLVGEVQGTEYRQQCEVLLAQELSKQGRLAFPECDCETVCGGRVSVCTCGHKCSCISVYMCVLVHECVNTCMCACMCTCVGVNDAVCK